MDNIDELYDLLDKENLPFDFETALNDYVEKHCDLDLPLTTRDIIDFTNDFCQENKYQLVKSDNLIMSEEEKKNFVKKQIAKAERSKSGFLKKIIVK